MPRLLAVLKLASLAFALAAAVTVALLLPAVATAQTDGLPPATEISQTVPLTEAAAAGLVSLTAKGGFGGDTVAVDLEGARIPRAPVTATVRIEFLGEQKNGDPWPQSKVDEIARGVEARLAGSKSSDGTPFRVVVDARLRTGTVATEGGTPGYHQIVLGDRPPATDASMVDGSPFGPHGEKAGNWGANESITTLAHETGHLLGLPDRYSARKPEWIGPDGRHVKLPELRGRSGDMAALNRWWETVTRAARALDDRYGRGDIQPAIPRGGENDIMADGTGAEHSKPMIPGDVDRLIAGAGVRVRSDPGDVLVNKAGDQQNMVVGAPFELYAPKGGRAHRDGLWAYCLDLRRHTPPAGGRYDVLGPASALAGTYPQYAALQRVVDEVARRQATEPGAGVAGPLGANDAIWAVTDGSEPGLEESKAILAAAGVAFDAATFAASPHFGNPNAGSATTGAVTTDGVLPAVAAERGGTVPEAGLPLPAPRLAYLRLASNRLRANRRGALTLRSLQDGSSTRFAVGLFKRGRAVRTPAPLAALTIAPGPQLTTVALPGLRAGRYVLLLTGTGPDRTVRRLAFRAVEPARATPAPRSGCGGRSCRGRTAP